MKRVTTSLATLVLAAFAASAALADPNEGVQFTTNSGIHLSQNAMAGWWFVPIRNITVDELGWYDRGGDGLTGSHEVGLWDRTAGGVLLASTIVTGADPLAPGSFFRYRDVPDVVLTAGRDYVIAGFDGADNSDEFNIARLYGSQTFHPDVEYVRAEAQQSAGFVYPFGAGASFGHFGANFLAVPEPTSLLLLGLGGLALRRRA